MKNLLFVIAAVLGFWFFPAQMDPGGFAEEILILAALFVVVVPIAVYFAIRRGLPEHVEMNATDEAAVPGSVRSMVGALEAAGFHRAGPPLRIHLGQEAVLVPLVNQDQNLYATAFRAGSNDCNAACDVVTIFDAPDCGLTTGMHHGAGVLPGEAGTLRQIFPGVRPAELVQRHQEAVAWLARSGLKALPADPAEFPRLFRKSIHISRRVFHRQPLLNTFRALWRTITKRNPHLGRLQEQEGIEALVRSLPTNRSQRASPMPVEVGQR